MKNSNFHFMQLPHMSNFSHFIYRYYIKKADGYHSQSIYYIVKNFLAYPTGCLYHSESPTFIVVVLWISDRHLTEMCVKGKPITISFLLIKDCFKERKLNLEVIETILWSWTYKPRVKSQKTGTGRGEKKRALGWWCYPLLK